MVNISVAIVLDPFDFLRIVLIVIAIYTNYSIGVPRVVDIVVKKVKEIRLKLIAHIYTHTYITCMCLFLLYKLHSVLYKVNKELSRS